MAREQRFMGIRQKEIFPAAHPLGRRERKRKWTQVSQSWVALSRQLRKQAKSIHFIDAPTKVEKPEYPAPNHRH